MAYAGQSAEVQRCIVAQPLIAVLLLAVALTALGESKPLRATALIGQRVLAAGGEPLGEIVGLLLDVRKLGVHYALLEAPASLGEKRFAYPVHAFRRGETGLLVLEARHVPDPQFHPGGYVPAARVPGKPVDDPLGNRVGTLVDLAIDLQTGGTRYFVVEFTEREGQPMPIPPHNVQLHRDRNPTVHGDRGRHASAD